MKKAIITKFIPAGNVRGSRIKAIAEGGNSATIGKPYSLSIAGGHCKAAVTLAAKMGWHGFYVGGGTPSGFAFVNMASDAHHGHWNHAKALATHARVGHDKPYGIEGEDWFYISIPDGGGRSTEIISDD